MKTGYFLQIGFSVTFLQSSHSIKTMKFPSDCYNIYITKLEKTEDYIHYKFLGIEVIYKSEGSMWTSNPKNILKVNHAGYGDIHFI